MHSTCISDKDEHSLALVEKEPLRQRRFDAMEGGIVRHKTALRRSAVCLDVFSTEEEGTSSVFLKKEVSREIVLSYIRPSNVVSMFTDCFSLPWISRYSFQRGKSCAKSARQRYRSYFWLGVFIQPERPRHRSLSNRQSYKRRNSLLRRPS